MTAKNNKLNISTLTNMGIKFEGKKILERCKKEEIEFN
jgi:post-segregation antitoxin (ccd killing protein)